MKISDMTFEELQDYALQLEEKNVGLETTNAALKAEKEELMGINLTLQKRNNDLFMRVEQSGSVTPAASPENEPETKTENCEDFARKLVEGGIL